MTNPEFAFPKPFGNEYPVQLGMYLRDWFAGQALNGVLSNLSNGESINVVAVSAMCYRAADAMMEERQLIQPEEEIKNESSNETEE
jgi:hypothetical protein